MAAVLDKAKISAIVGVFTSIAAIVYGYANYTMLIGIATFIFVLMIQYSSFKFKIAVSLIAILGIIYTAYNHMGIH